MANKTISDLRELSTVSDNSVLVVETNNKTFKVTKENLLKEVNTQLNTKSNENHTHDEYVTESELNAKGLATETFVTQKIAEASLNGGEVVLSDYYTKSEVDNKDRAIDDKITVLNATMSSRYSNQQIDEKVSEMVITKINGDLVFRDIFEGEKFEINEDNVVAPPTDVYGNILISTTTLSFDENASTTFTVKLDKAPTNVQVVNLSVNNAYCTLSKTNLTFTSSNYSTAQTVTVVGVHDSNNYSNKTSIINLTSPNVANKTISVTIKNADTPPVVTVPVTGVSLSQSTHAMKVGQTHRLTATVSPSDATNQNVTWSVSNSNATVVNGLVTALSEGECIITVTTEDGGKTATCQMIIEEKAEDEIIPIDVIPVIDLDIANWDETTTLTDKCGNYPFTINDISKYSKTEDGGIFITSSSPAHTTFESPTSFSVRIKMTYNQLVNNYGRFWRWDGDKPSLYVEKSANCLTYKINGMGSSAYRCIVPNTYADVLIDVVCCYEATTNAITMYINGEEVGEVKGTVNEPNRSTTLAIGNIETNTYNIDFVLYAFQVYDQALNAEQIRGLYHVG